VRRTSQHSPLPFEMTEYPTEDTGRRAAVLWTGGKDSCLALYEAALQGLQIERLITFVPGEGRFRAHPLEFLGLQAQALGLAHHTLEIKEPYREGYQQAIVTLKERWGIQTLVTGDMAEVEGHPNWMRECCAGSDVEILTPLWGRGGVALLDHFLSCGFLAVFSCVKQPWLSPDWLGRELDTQALAELAVLAHDTGLDVCGEQGEYHTLVLDGPPFEKRICIDACEKKAEDHLAYVEFGQISLRDKQKASHEAQTGAGAAPTAHEGPLDHTGAPLSDEGLRCS
jgi:diphthine-ammonia ligase